MGNMYAGVDGVARKVSKAYIGVDGVAQPLGGGKFIILENGDFAVPYDIEYEGGAEASCTIESKAPSYYYVYGSFNAKEGHKKGSVIIRDIDFGGFESLKMVVESYQNGFAGGEITIDDTIVTGGIYRSFDISQLTGKHNITVRVHGENIGSYGGYFYHRIYGMWLE